MFTTSESGKPTSRRKSNRAGYKQKSSVESTITAILTVDAVINPLVCQENWFLKTAVLPSFVCSCALQYLGSSPFFSNLIFPFVQFSLKSLLNYKYIQRMQSALNALYNFAVPRAVSGSSSLLETGCSGLLRDLVLNQERTMFYTATLTPATTEATEPVHKISPNLKWQCACTLSRSQSVIRRTNSNSSQYYTITYMPESDLSLSNLSLDSQSSLGSDGEMEFSPVRIYINS